VAKSKPPQDHVPPRVSDLLRVPVAGVDLNEIDPRSTPGFTGDKEVAKAAQEDHAPELADLQERLFAEGRSGGTRSVLIVLQGMDTSGKGGTVRHVLGQVDPQGCQVTSFGAPTDEERKHDFLWRIERQLPKPGRIGVFDRSHYEDVGVVRVHNLVPKATWSKRYDQINEFEQRLVSEGTRVVKCFLHISRAESKERLLARLDDPEKLWKFNPGDIDERAYWDSYLEVYSDAIRKCNTELAPWFVVPADRKWYRNWAVTKLLLEQLQEMALRWPAADYDVDAERKRLLEAE
jgi:PPK2 family polyphosphate:nucleotide phosphotransferase